MHHNGIMKPKSEQKKESKQSFVSHHCHLLWRYILQCNLLIQSYPSMLSSLMLMYLLTMLGTTNIGEHMITLPQSLPSMVLCFFCTLVVFCILSLQDEKYATRRVTLSEASLRLFPLVIHIHRSQLSSSYSQRQGVCLCKSCSLRSLMVPLLPSTSFCNEISTNFVLLPLILSLY